MTNAPPPCSALSRRALVLGALAAGTAPAAAQFGAGARSGVVALRATLGERGPEIGEELVWRIFTVRGSDAQFFAKLEQPRPSVALPVGEYAIHVSYGLATATRQVNVNETGMLLTLPVTAGSLTAKGYLGVPENPLPPHRQRIAVYIPTANNSEGRLVTNNLRPGSVMHLPEGVYHLVSTYSGSNSVVRSDIKIETGRLTEAVVNHKAATMTLKLVRQAGGVAIAGVEWTIETPGGDIIAEAVGAFPNVDVAEGSYSVLARHNEREFRGTMKVEGGVNRDFEIVAE